ncbi:hypothetical protein PROFUN_02295 [Planoprotostelium fungivorum]|uniref:Alpha-mannosidase n=1 Tax=Planoprotostelium fungivorum TaxID=1890364 RepID=A0A2P6NYI4_9EUKA|nr:hypothetical protein PROFUN_02295 [Planoprotostelium fungivorum]
MSLRQDIVGDGLLSSRLDNVVLLVAYRDPECQKMRAAAICLLLFASALGALRPIQNFDLTPADVRRSTPRDRIEVFVVTHSHDDVGWLKPMEGYYKDQVVYIISSMLVALKANPVRKYTQVEVAFVRRWWQDATQDQKTALYDFYHAGRIEFNLGGITMNDEATSSYYQEINQMTDGAKWLQDNLGAVPTAAWHIDPFGHSAATASLWSLMGFNGFGLNRIPYDIKNRMKMNQGLEFIWRGSDSYGKTTEMFAHVMDSHYSTPNEMNFDGNWDVAQVADATVKMAKERNSWYRHRYLLIPFGDDFTHTNAPADYDNMDRLMDYINARPDYGVTLKYAVLSDYINAVNALNLTWSVMDHADFFPYNDGPNSYWSGYYASRPAYKHSLRKADALLHATEVMLTTVRNFELLNDTSSYDGAVQELRMATAIGTHHDAVSGTENTRTWEDYERMLTEGKEAVRTPVTRMSEALTAVAPSDAADVEYFSVMNPLGWNRDQVLSIYTNYSGATVTVNGKSVSSQVNPLPTYTTLNAKYRLYFVANLGPLSSTVFKVSWSQNEATRPVGSKTLNNGNIELAFDEDNKLHSVTNVKAGKKASVSMDYKEYMGMTDNGQNSGAYIFRPAADNTIDIGSNQNFFKTMIHNYHQGSFDARPYLFTTARSQKDDELILTGYATSQTGFGLMATNPGKSSGWNSNPVVDVAPWEDFPMRNTLPNVKYAMGRVTVKGSASSKASVQVQFSSSEKGVQSFSTVPVVHVSVATKGTPTPNLYTLVASVMKVDENSFTAVVQHYLSESGWSDDDTEVQLDWLAVEPGYAQSGQNYILAGTFNISANSRQALVSYHQATMPNSIILLAAQSTTGIFTSNTVDRDANHFTAIVRRTDQEDQAHDDVILHYMVMPRLGYEKDVRGQVDSKVFDGPLVQEAQLDFGGGYGQTVVQYKVQGLSGNYTEIVTEIGPMPREGRELVLRMDTSLNSGSVLYTDDNGLEMMKRRVNYNTAEITAGNFYPIIQRAIMKDQKEDLQLNLLSEATHGASSLSNGRVEIMLNRRCQEDDGRGVGEPINDMSPLRTELWLTLSGREEATVYSRYLSVVQQFPPIITKVTGDGRTFSAVEAALPENVHLLTMREFRSEKERVVLVRFQHIYARNEHPVLSVPVKIDLKTVLGPAFGHANITEYNLNAAKPIQQMNKLSWKTNKGALSTEPKAVKNGILKIQPMEIRTFLYTL